MIPLRSSRRTKIMATLGPSTDKPGVLAKLLKAGMDIVRLNAAHADEATHARRIRQVRQLARQLRKTIVIHMDLAGPKFRVGRFPRPSIALKTNSEVRLGVDLDDGGLPVANARFLRKLRRGDVLALADGTVLLNVLSVGKTPRARVQIGGSVRSGSGINLPTAEFSVHIPTAQDKRAILFALRRKIDWLGVSFVRTPKDIRRVRRHLGKRAKRPLVMAKIEKRQALIHLNDIIAEADGVMVARGDLGVETPLEQVPLEQKRIIAEARAQKKPVVTATQMLESMVENPTPTRAEATDVVNAVLDGTDGVMLSAETAIGAYPVAAVSMLRRLVLAAEGAMGDSLSR